jgi:hypothetical protein
MEIRIASSNRLDAKGSPHREAPLVALDVAALLRAFLRTGGGDPALALARVLTLATVLRGLTGALALAAIAADALHTGLIARTAILRKHWLRSEHQANYRRENGSAGLYPVHRCPPVVDCHEA